MRNARIILLLFVSLLAGIPGLRAETPYSSATDFAKYAMKLRENALLKVEPQVYAPSQTRSIFSTKFPWKTNIYTTIFWVGENATVNNPVHNRSSSWDANWNVSFGGYDNPDREARRGYIPAKFIPQQNPFYVALPYNDVTHGSTKPEARIVIPWFREAFVKEGQSVCRDRWVAIRKGSRICYAQWADCGPFRTDHWQYVFGNDRPKPNLNRGAGLDVSPAVRDFLGLSNIDVTDWKFVDLREIPPGPWALYGENNHFVQLRRRGASNVASSKAVPGSKAPSVSEPVVITR